MSAERKPLSRRLRFEIFKRDGFRCTYCGATPVIGPLHVDHVKPVVEGGTNDPSNLATACGACNLGKSRVPLEKKRLAVGRLTEADLDHAEQIHEYLAVQRDVAQAKRALEDQLIEEWTRRLGDPPEQLRPRVVSMATEFGIDRLLEAFDAVARKELRSTTAQIKYLHGVLRRWREKAAPVAPSSKTERPRVVRTRTAVLRAVHEVIGNPDAYSDFDAILGHIAQAFARSAGASEREVEIYYSDGAAVGLEFNDGEGIVVHGIRLRTETELAGTRWFVEQVEGWNAFEEAYDSLIEEINNEISYTLVQMDLGNGATLEHLERAATALNNRGREIHAWISKYRTEDLGEDAQGKGPTRG